MSPALVFGISIAFSLIAWGIVARHLWPDQRRLTRADALRPLLLLHAFRFVGLSFLVPGVVSLDLPADGHVLPPTAISLLRYSRSWR